MNVKTPTTAKERTRFARSLARILARQTELDAAKLSRAVGVDKASISHYLRGDRIPTVIVAYRMAQELGVTLEELVTGRKPGQRIVKQPPVS